MTNGAERRDRPDNPDGVTGGWRWLIHSDIENASDTESRVQSTQIPTIIRAFIGDLLRLQGAAQWRNLQFSKLERHTSCLAIPVGRNSMLLSRFAPTSRFLPEKPAVCLLLFHNQRVLDCLAAWCLHTRSARSQSPKAKNTLTSHIIPRFAQTVKPGNYQGGWEQTS